MSRVNIDAEGLEANLTFTKLVSRHVISTDKRAKWAVYYASLSILGHFLPSELSRQSTGPIFVLKSQRDQYVSQRTILLGSPPRGRSTHRVKNTAISSISIFFSIYKHNKKLTEKKFRCPKKRWAWRRLTASAFLVSPRIHSREFCGGYVNTCARLERIARIDNTKLK